jgi:hypothetical protein
MHCNELNTLKSPAEFLSDFYQIRGVEENDLKMKYHSIKDIVVIPNFPYHERKPYLAELEVQLLRDNGFAV